MAKILFVLFSVFVVVGQHVQAAPKGYSIDPGGIYFLPNPIKSPKLLAGLKSLRGKSASIDSFTLADGVTPTAECAALRGQYAVLPPKGRSFEEYIHDALVDHLNLVDASSPDAQQKITGNITEISLASGADSDHCIWQISLRLDSPNGKGISAKGDFVTKKGVSTNLVQNTLALLNGFADAVSKAMEGAIGHPDFVSLFDAK